MEKVKLSVMEAAKRLGITTDFIYKEIASGKLLSEKKHWRRWIMEQDLEGYISNYGYPTKRNYEKKAG